MLSDSLTGSELVESLFLYSVCIANFRLYHIYEFTLYTYVRDDKCETVYSETFNNV